MSVDAIILGAFPSPISTEYEDGFFSGKPVCFVSMGVLPSIATTPLPDSLSSVLYDILLDLHLIVIDDPQSAASSPKNIRFN